MKKYTYVSEIIEDVKNESSTNKKIEILKSQADNKELKYALYLAYNDYIQFYIRKIPGYIQNESFNNISLYNALSDIENILATRKKTGNVGKMFLTFLLESVVAEDAPIIEKVIARNFDCGISIKTINKVWPDLIPTFDVMLCSDFERDRVEYPCMVQEKLDGMRALLFSEDGEKYTIRSRKGLVIDDLDNFQEVRSAMATGWVLDGELVVYDTNGKIMSRKKGNGICNKAIKGTISEDEASRIAFFAFDVVPIDTFKGKTEFLGTQERFEMLTNLVNSVNSPKLLIASNEIVSNERQILKMFTEFTEQGMEGVVVKNSNQPFEAKRSKGWMKMKMENEMELAIDEVVEGLGKHRGRLGTLKCRDASGRLTVGIGGGYSDDQREEFWAMKDELIGQIITVRYNELISDDYGDISLFLPRFIEHRLDKTEADDVFNLIS